MITDCYKVYFFDHKITKFDIAQAVAEHGYAPVKICLNPQLAALAADIPQGIDAEYRGGILTTEVWLADVKEVPVYCRWPQFNIRAEIEAEKEKSDKDIGETIMSPINGEKNRVDIINSQPPIEKRGPKFHILPDDLIKELAASGLGAKAITSRLRVQGVVVSYKTIQRRLAGQGGLI